MPSGLAITEEQIGASSVVGVWLRATAHAINVMKSD